MRLEEVAVARMVSLQRLERQHVVKNNVLAKMEILQGNISHFGTAGDVTLDQLRQM